MSNECEIIGDVHGKTVDYVPFVIRLEHPSIALGDFGDGVVQKHHMMLVDHDQHRILGGNHDNYYSLLPHYLGNYGHTPFIKSGFYIRGALTPPWASNKRYPQEQLEYGQLSAAMQMYAKAEPKIMLTHAPPQFIVSALWPRLTSYREDVTGLCFDQCWDAHRPKVWVFGHMHEFKVQEIGGTLFVCLPELGNMTVIENWDEEYEIMVTLDGGETFI